jgi:hypothetical protein
MQQALNRRPEPQGQGSFRPSFSTNSLSPCTTRRPRLTAVSELKSAPALGHNLGQDILIFACHDNLLSVDIRKRAIKNPAWRLPDGARFRFWSRTWRAVFRSPPSLRAYGWRAIKRAERLFGGCVETLAPLDDHARCRRQSGLCGCGSRNGCHGSKHNRPT